MTRLEHMADDIESLLWRVRKGTLRDHNRLLAEAIIELIEERYLDLDSLREVLPDVSLDCVCDGGSTRVCTGCNHDAAAVSDSKP